MSREIFVDRSGLLDQVHDLWFDLLQLTFQEERRQASLWLGSNRKGPYDDKLLTITDVSDFAIHDEARIQIYDLCDIRMEDSAVRLTSAFPLEIVFRIGNECKILVTQNASSGGTSMRFVYPPTVA